MVGKACTRVQKGQEQKFSSSISVELDEWDEAVGEFDLEGIMDGRKLGAALLKVYYGIMEEEKTRPLYMGPEIYPEAMGADGFPMPDQLTLVPERYFLRVIPAATVAQYYPLPDPGGKIELPPVDDRDPETAMLAKVWGDVVAQRAVYELVFERKEEAKRMKALLMEIDSKRPMPRSLEGI